MEQQLKVKSVLEQCKTAYDNKKHINLLDTEEKNQLLTKIIDQLEKKQNEILDANAKDIEAAKKSNISNALLDRLTLTKSRINDINDSIRTIINLEDPIGKILSKRTLPNNLTLKKIVVPMGVIGIIYEARPNVTADAISLAIKTNSAIVLRGSSSAYNTNKKIVEIFKDSFGKINHNGIQLLEDTSRSSVLELVQAKDYLDLVIPRGGQSLINTVVENATVPAIETGTGNCHIYLDNEINLNNAFTIIQNAKTQRPSVCNACEKIIIHKDLFKNSVTKLIGFLKELNLEIKVCKNIKKLQPEFQELNKNELYDEFLDLKVGLILAESIDDAISHINKYGSKHSETICSTNNTNIKQFQNEIDAAAVIANASSRFVDGGEFGFGAELGISTQKLHARGPMGLPEICTYKYLVEGDGQIRV